MGDVAALHSRRRLAAMGALATVAAIVLFTATSLPAAAASAGDPTPVTTQGTANDPSVATDGTDFLVVWTQTVSNALEVYAAQVKGDGSVVKPAFALSSTGDSRNDYSPTVAWDGSKYLVAWEHAFSDTDTDVYGQVVTRAGFLLGGLRIISNPSSRQSKPSVTAHGNQFLVVWTDDRNGNNDIFRGRLSDDGTVLDNTGVEVTSGSSIDYAPDVASNSGGYLVTYQRQSGSAIDLYGQRLNASAAEVGTPFPISTSADVEEAPKVASNGTDYLVVWNQSNAGNILGARVSSSGTVQGSVTVSTAPSTQDLPDVAFNGSYLVAWRDARNGSPAGWATRISSTGTVQDPNGFLVDPGPGLVGGPAVSAAPAANTWAVVVDHFSGGGIIQRTASSSK